MQGFDVDEACGHKNLGDSRSRCCRGAVILNTAAPARDVGSKLRLLLCAADMPAAGESTSWGRHNVVLESLRDRALGPEVFANFARLEHRRPLRVPRWDETFTFTFCRESGYLSKGAAGTRCAGAIVAQGRRASIGLLIIAPLNLFGDSPVLGALDDAALLTLLCVWFVSRAVRRVEPVPAGRRSGSALAVR
jgi:hypothetical protein